MKTSFPKYLSNVFKVLFFLFFAFSYTACSKDDTKNEVETEINDNSQTDEEVDTSEDPDTENPDTENPDPEEPDTDAQPDVVFEQNLVLNGERMFVNLVLSENEYNKYINGEGNLSMVSTKMYEYLKDDFDFMVILSVEETHPGDLFYGRSTAIQNLIQGLGIGLFDLSGNYGSAGRLKSMIYMPRTEYVQNGPFLHEITHTWANKGFLSTTVSGHWGYAGTAGQLGGFDELIDNGNGTYQGMLNGESGFGSFANGGNSIEYGNLELYLMGLIPDTELEPLQIAINPVALNDNGLFSADSIEERSPGMLISAKGPRSPSFENAQKAFSGLVVVISKSAIGAAKADDINTDLENFSRQDTPDWGGSHNFFTATHGKGTFTFTISDERIK